MKILLRKLNGAPATATMIVIVLAAMASPFAASDFIDRKSPADVTLPLILVGNAGG